MGLERQLNHQFHFALQGLVHRQLRQHHRFRLHRRFLPDLALLLIQLHRQLRQYHLVHHFLEVPERQLLLLDLVDQHLLEPLEVPVHLLNLVGLLHLAVLAHPLNLAVQLIPVGLERQLNLVDLERRLNHQFHFALRVLERRQLRQYHLVHLLHHFLLDLVGLLHYQKFWHTRHKEHSLIGLFPLLHSLNLH